MKHSVIQFPPQQLSFNRKNKKWRKQCVDWADSKTFFNYSPVRNSVVHKKINYDLLNGKLHMSDLQLILNPENIQAGYIPETIQHYPIINTKLEVLRGEESARIFDYKVVVTNPNAISEIENSKKEQIIVKLQELVANTAQSEEEYQQEVQKISDYYTYEWQDLREIRANALLNHYVKEYNMPLMFNEGFMDALAVGEEIYQCDIISGEPTIERLNSLKVRVFKSGYSNKIEDADMIILEDYWSPGKIIDTYHDVLTKKDIDYIESLPFSSSGATSDSMDNIDPRAGFVNAHMIGEEITSEEGFFWDPFNSTGDGYASLLPYDTFGNVRVMRVYWKSRRKIKKVKSYNPETGEEIFNFYTENYIPNTVLGEEEEIYYINEAWEGTKIGEEIYVNMRPRVVQYNSLSNPSRCHFGIVGSIYNINDNKPFSLIDRMKPYNYLYDAIHDRLNKLISHNWGKLIQLDLAKVPKGWDVEKWMYYAKVNNIVVVDSFKEGNAGAAMGKLAGGLNNASSGVIDAEVGNVIQQNINLLEFIKMEMADVAGISRQREGQIANRETVGGVERSTLQSSHITEWLFLIHNDVKRRALEVFLETAKIALRGRSKKFQYILPDSSMRIMEIPGDEFAENDYGLVVDSSSNSQKLMSQMETLAQAALQNNLMSFSTLMKLYNSSSLAEKQRLVEREEQAMQERASQAQQQQLQAEQQRIQMEAEQKEKENQLKDLLNQRDNETKLFIAQLQLASSEDANRDEEYDSSAKEALMEKMREFDEKIKLDREKLEFEKQKHKEDNALKERISNKKSSNSK